MRTISGDEIPADFVVIGIGVKLNTDLARDAGLDLDHTGAITVDQNLRTSDPDIYAAGDVAAFPDKFTGVRTHLEHYMNGSWQGEVVGANLGDAHALREGWLLLLGHVRYPHELAGRPAARWRARSGR